MPSYEAVAIRVQVGQLKHYEEDGRQWQSAIEKTSLETVSVTLAGLAGDQQTGDIKDPDRAVCCHPLTHYRFWEAYYRKPFPIGILAENLTLSHIADEDVCIGDIVRCGTVLLQVTQPRTPCWKPAQRIGEPDFVKRIEQTGRRGWLMRVLEVGTIQVNDVYHLVERPHPEVPLPYVNRKFHDPSDKAVAQWLSTIPAMGAEYRRHFSALSS
jgi:MOSC domain-containing protein YiiM